MLNLIAGLVTPDAGEIRIETVGNKTPHIGYVWQDYRASLLPWFSVGENISFPLMLANISNKRRKALAEQALSGFVTDIGVEDPVYRLSGGQQQLVCLLRSSIADPDILLLDEPLSALDQPTRWTMAFHIERSWMERRIPALFVSHDIDEAVMLADQILLMGRNGGQIVDILENTLHRPRSAKMLTSSEHIRCRDQVIQFLFEQGAIRDRHSQTNRLISRTT